MSGGHDDNREIAQDGGDLGVKFACMNCYVAKHEAVRLDTIERPSKFSLFADTPILKCPSCGAEYDLVTAVMTCPELEDIEVLIAEGYKATKAQKEIVRGSVRRRAEKKALGAINQIARDLGIEP